MRKLLLFFTLLNFYFLSGQTTLANYKFEDNLDPQSGSTAAPTIVTLFNPDNFIPYAGLSSNRYLLTKVVNRGEKGGYIMFSVSTTGYTKIKMNMKWGSSQSTSWDLYVTKSSTSPNFSTAPTLILESDNNFWKTYVQPQPLSGVDNTGTVYFYLISHNRVNNKDVDFYLDDIIITGCKLPTISDLTVPNQVCSGSNLTLTTPTVTANDATVISQGWRIETEKGSGVYTDFLSPFTVNYSDNGKKLRYRVASKCDAADPITYSYSNEVVITVNDKPTVGTISTPSTLCAGNNLSLTTPSVTSNGSNITLQGWELSDAAGTNFTTLSSSYAVTYADNGKKIRYYATNSCGTTYSNEVILNINEAPTLVLTSANSSPTVCANTAISPIVYTWGGGATGVSVSPLPAGLISVVNSTAKTVTISGTPTSGGTYSVSTTGQVAPCSSISSGGTITVNPIATLVQSGGTTNQTVCAGNAITNIVYTWGGGATGVIVSGLPAGLTTATDTVAKTFTISGTPTSGGTYSVSTTGQVAPCSSISSGGTMTVNPATTITTHPKATTTYCKDVAATALSVTAIGTSPLNYQWYSNTTNSTSGGTLLTEFTSSTYTPSTATVGTMYYYAVVTGPCGNATSQIAAVTVNRNIVASVSISALPNTPICAGTPVTFTATPTDGGTTPTYQWFRKGVLAAVTSTNTYTASDLGDGEQVWVAMQSSETVCVTGSPATSNTVTVNHVGTTTWNGTAWSQNTTKDHYLKAEILANYSKAENLYVCSMHVKNTSKVEIPLGTSITVYNDIIVDPSASLTVKSDGNLIQVHDNAINSGNITVERDSRMIRLDYAYWGSPVKGQVLRDFSPKTVANRFYSYNEGYDAFQVIANLQQPMVPEKGYVVRAPDNFTANYQIFTGVFKGVPNNGIINTPVNMTNASRGRNLVGNPYPSDIDLELLTELNPDIAEGIYFFWDNKDVFQGNVTTDGGQYGVYARNQYAYYTSTGGVPSGNGLAIPSGFVRPGQGFIMQALKTGTLRFNNSLRIPNELQVSAQTEPTVFFPNKQITETRKPNRFWLRLTSSVGNHNTLLIGYVKGATNQFEKRYDAQFPAGTSEQFYSISGNRNLIIQGRAFPFSQDDSVALGMKYFAGGKYTISLPEKQGMFADGQQIYLKDRLTGIITNLSEQSYTFSTEAGTSNNRFEIIYKPQTVLATEVAAKDELQVYRDGNDFVIKTKSEKITAVEIFDAAGRLVHKVQSANNKVTINGEVLPNGIYLLKIDHAGKTTVRKILK